MFPRPPTLSVTTGAGQLHPAAFVPPQLLVIICGRRNGSGSQGAFPPRGGWVLAPSTGQAQSPASLRAHTLSLSLVSFSGCLQGLAY